MLSLLRQFAGIPVANRARRLARAFLRQTQQADQVQRALLQTFLSRNASSQFGSEHAFAQIKDPDDYRRRVPIRDYAGHEPYIAEVRKGNLGALFGPDTDVLMFAMTSGTTATPKTIPVTKESLRAYRDGWKIWGIRAFDDHPAILAHGLKPILQLVSDWRERQTEGGIPCGAITGLTAAMQNPLVRGSYCMPPATMRVKDVDSKYYLALRLSLHRNVGALMAANPSTLLGIARLGERNAAQLLRDLAQGTLDSQWDIPTDVRNSLASAIRKKHPRIVKSLEKSIEHHGALRPAHFWPSLDFVANWTGGTMGAYLSSYPDWFGDTPVRDIGLIASEGRFTIPISDHTPAGVLDIRHHFFEFLPETQIGHDQPDTLLAHELKPGDRYYILPTTAGGLYRYQISDLIRCTGFEGRAPLIEFLNKGAHFSSLAGEKLSEFQVVEAVDQTARDLGLRLSGYLLLPKWGETPGYELLVEAPDLPTDSIQNMFVSVVESKLSKINCEYENRLETKRLLPLKLQLVQPGSWIDFRARRLAAGGTPEQYKQPRLLADLDLIHHFKSAPQSGQSAHSNSPA
jgi:hypothetical protein